MDFIEMWNEAIDNDPYWQFEDLLEEDPELAEQIWDELRVRILVQNRLGFDISDIELPKSRNDKR